MLIIRGILGGLFQLAIIAALIIVPAGLAAGAWDWVRGWQFIGGYGVVMMTAIIAVGIFAPRSLEARLKSRASEKQPAKDKIATFFVILSIGLYFVFIPLDVFLWQLLGQPAGIIPIIGAVLFLGGYALIIWTIFANSFAIPIVEDQSDQGQTLIDTGPYAFVRHPMYLGILFYLSGIGLFLQSWASLPMLIPVLLALILRIRIEEKTLLETLDGYTEFSEKRPYRLLPFVW